MNQAIERIVRFLSLIVSFKRLLGQLLGFAQFAAIDEMNKNGKTVTFTYGINKSKELTMNYKKRLFLYNLSFIFWWILLLALMIITINLFIKQRFYLAIISVIAFISIHIYVSVYRKAGRVLLYHEAKDIYQEIKTLREQMVNKNQNLNEDSTI